MNPPNLQVVKEQIDAFNFFNVIKFRTIENKKQPDYVEPGVCYFLIDKNDTICFHPCSMSADALRELERKLNEAIRPILDEVCLRLLADMKNNLEVK